MPSERSAHELKLSEMVSEYISFDKAFMNSSIRSIIKEDEEGRDSRLKSLVDSEEEISLELSKEVFFIY